ncbi:MAG: HEPN domain-containing protein [Candidatus Berkelbacteria bacterium Licking1014_2]|uniref:HEPN domain-containing protein n=1 Tax=Candidatus Berkelbacteria bacterium Licking1014_2 TaxID=2017146 RepID=A0A554LUY0_9BACT|nr:MAG: HEPN domain-containing protein [Candidatus Berkelbacteria bacterium Licking1014_2]
MKKEEMIGFWIVNAREDWSTAELLLQKKKYNYALFFCHLSIEKLFKAYLINKNIKPPHTHDLERLLLLAKVNGDDIHRQWLSEITTFSIAARYDDYKLQFYRKATSVYADKWFKRCREIYQWLKEKID